MAFDEGTQQAITSPDYFRTGFRPTEIPRLNEMIEAGKSAEEIAQHFGVQLEVVKKFMKKPASSPAEVETEKKEDEKFEEAVKKATRRGRDN